MKKASKFLCALLAVVLTAALAVPAFASTADLGRQWQKEACDLLKVTFSNPACGAGDLRWNGSADDVTHVIVVPDGTTMTMNPDCQCIRRGWDWDDDGTMSTDMWVPYVPADSEGSEWAYGGALSTATTFTFGGKHELRGFALQNEENIADDEQFYYAPVAWYAVMSQSTANFLTNGDENGTIFVFRSSDGTSQPTTPTTPTTPGAKPAPGVSVPLNDGSGEFAYTVKPGDTLSKIAAYYYGNVNVYKLIYERNKDTLKSPNAIYAGQTIILPSYAAVAQGAASTTPAEPTAPTAVKPAPGVSVSLNDGSGEFAYTVKSGDTLGRIAAYYYGDVNVYKLIYERNKDALKSANTIYAGQTIILPSYAAVAQGAAKL